MKQSTWHLYYIILMAILAIVTLGGLGNAAFVVDKFYWIPFFLNLGLYIVAGIKLYQKMKILEKEGK